MGVGRYVGKTGHEAMTGSPIMATWRNGSAFGFDRQRHQKVAGSSPAVVILLPLPLECYFSSSLLSLCKRHKVSPQSFNFPQFAGLQHRMHDVFSAPDQTRIPAREQPKLRQAREALEGRGVFLSKPNINHHQLRAPRHKNSS